MNGRKMRGMTTQARKIKRFRGCFIGGPLDGQALPAHVQAGGVAFCRCEVPGVPGLSEVRYLHRRAAQLVGDVLEETEFLVHDGLTDDAAAALVDAHREQRGGWGEAVVTLPAAGYWYRPEMMRWHEIDETGRRVERVAVSYVTRLSPDGACVARGMADESRALSREEVDPTRCGWCEEGIGHTLDEHRHRLEQTAAAERAAEFEGPTLEDLAVSPLSLAVAAALHGPPDDVLALDQAFRAGLERTLAKARAEFVARREAEDRPALVLPG